MSRAGSKMVQFKKGLLLANRKLERLRIKGQKAGLMLSEKLEEMVTLHHLSHATRKERNLKELLKIIVREISIGADAERVVLFLIDQENRVLTNGTGTKDVPHELLRKDYPLNREESLLARVSLDKKVYFIEDAEDNPLVIGPIQEVLRPRFLFCASLIVAGEAIGVIQVDNPRTFRPIDKEKRKFLALLADQAALAIRNVQLYEEIKNKNMRLEQLNKAKSRFIADVAHDLKSPLVSVKEGISLVLDRLVGEVNEKQEGFLLLARENVDRIVRLIDELLSLSKIEAGKMQLHLDLINISTLASQVIDTIRNQANKKQIALETSLDENLTDIWADPDKIIRVFTNLLTNAIKFTSPKGKVTVRTKDEKGYVRAEVIDTGCGIPEDQLDKVFKRFERIDIKNSARVPGHGLGLSIAKDIITLHKGKIWVESKVGKGSSFIFTLPKKPPK